jgi:hypothetical protein
MKAVRALKSSGGLPPSASGAQASAPTGGVSSVPRPAAAPAAAAPQPIAAEAKPESTSFDRQAILDDPKLNGILQSMPGTKIVDIKEK